MTNQEKKHVRLRSNFETEKMKNVTDKFNIQVFRTPDPDFEDDTIVLRITGKEGEPDIGYNIGTTMSEKIVEYLDSLE